MEGIEKRVRMFSRFEHRIAVCHRSADGLNAEQRMEVIRRAVSAGCNAVDIDWQEERDYPAALYLSLIHISEPTRRPG